VQFDAVYVSSRLSQIDERRLATEARLIQPHLKIIVASGSPLAVATPFIDFFIQKPSSLHALYHVVKQVINRKNILYSIDVAPMLVKGPPPPFH